MRIQVVWQQQQQLHLLRHYNLSCRIMLILLCNVCWTNVSCENLVVIHLRQFPWQWFATLYWLLIWCQLWECGASSRYMTVWKKSLVNELAVFKQCLDYMYNLLQKHQNFQHIAERVNHKTIFIFCLRWVVHSCFPCPCWSPAWTVDITESSQAISRISWY